MRAMKCSLHPETELVCPSCIAANNRGVTSRAKAEAARINGAKGGRPKGSGKKKKR
jgi:hypothetical protein